MVRAIKSAKTFTLQIASLTILDVTNFQGPAETGQHDGHEYASSTTAGVKYEVPGHRKKFGSFEILADKMQTGLANMMGTIKSMTATTAVGITVLSAVNVLLKAGPVNAPIQEGAPYTQTIEWAEAEV